MSDEAVRFPTRDAVIASFADHVSRGRVKAFEALGLDLVMGEREGARFRDAYSGQWFWNCHCNGGVFNLGHRNPRVIAAVRRGLDDYDVGNHYLVSQPRAALAERLAATTGGRLPGVVYGAGGGEAVDLALKLARSRGERRTIVSATGAYHGHTGLAVATGDPQFRDPFHADLPGFLQVPFDDLDALETVVDETTAAVILESIPATLGMPLPSPGYLAGVERICRAAGALLILDEVQTGLGRTGTFWSHEQDDVRPDVIVTGKGLSGGIYPMSATLVSAELFAFFDDKPFVHISTFGGSEIGCLAAIEVVDMVQEAGFLDRVRALGDRFAAGFEGMPFELRRRGMFMGLKFDGEADGIEACVRLVRNGVFAVFAGNDTSVVQFLPPLVVTDAEADEIVDAVRGALG